MQMRHKTKIARALAAAAIISLGAAGLARAQPAAEPTHETIASIENFSAGWSHVVASRGLVLFYKDKTGEAGVGKVSSTGVTTLQTFPKGNFGSGWTHIVPLSSGRILWYRADNGAGAIGQLDATGNHETLTSWEPGSFAKGWTRIVEGPNGLVLWYNGENGKGAIGQLR